MKSWQEMGLGWRSSIWFTTWIVWMGLATDQLVYTLLVPAIPFQLEKLGYKKISSLAGWLLFAYSAGLVLSTPPIASLSERYKIRRLPMIAGILIQIGSQIILMEAPNFAVMCIARILLGVGSSLVWTAGMALLCDAVPEELIGRQLGIAMSGLALGITIGPPIGGAFYARFGFRGPIIFGTGVCVVDMIGRFLVIEAKKNSSDTALPTTGTLKVAGQDVSTVVELAPLAENATPSETVGSAQARVQQSPSANTLLTVIIRLLRSPRTIVALLMAFVYGIIYAGPEASIVLHLQEKWRLKSGKVGLIFLSASLPTLLSSVLSGWLTDRLGAEWVTFAYLLFATPWWIFFITVRHRLPSFAIAFAAEYFFASGAVAPLTAELASISRTTEGVGFAHTYGAFNIFYGIGSAVGPVLIGHLYDRLHHGWAALCIVAMSFVIIALVLSFFYTGANPLFNRLVSCLRDRRSSRDNITNSSAVDASKDQ